MSLRDYTALTFDVYGALIDWESGMVTGLQPLNARNRHRDVGRRIAVDASLPRERGPGTDAAAALFRNLGYGLPPLRRRDGARRRLGRGDHR